MLRNVSKMLKVLPVPALEDNYMYIVYNGETKKGLAIDPVEPERIKQEAEKLNVSIVASLVTHHHWDHAGGMPRFRELWPAIDVQIFGGDDRIEKMTHLVKHEEVIDLADLKVKAFSTPCHTKGHICYYVTKNDGSEGIVLTGDTLFIAGCGKFFEGNAKEMHRNLNEVLASLPDSTMVYPGHEYTASNLRFAASVEPNNKVVKDKLAWALSCKEKKQPTVPSTIGDEKTFNPFMRVRIPEVQQKVNATDPVEVMHNLREMKNSFRG